jgi:septal ring factor EnvC (AmiA/AmiB activator)
VLTVDDVLSQQFEARKGSLSLPVEGTMVHFDTATKYICYNPIVNSGIDIACRAGSCVRTVHEGTVSSIFSVDNDDKMVVIVKHGNYFTVYNSVAQTTVKKGERLTANQEIGTVAVNDDGEPRLNFQIWKAAPGNSKKEKQNPEVWVVKSY